MKYSALISLLAMPCFSQLNTGRADTKGTCSPANTGSNNTFTITCGIGKEQGNQMLKILNKILANQLDPDAVMKKLDEILHAVNPNAPQITYTFNGFKRVMRPGRVSGGDDGGGEIFKQMSALERANDWVGLIKLSEAQMRERPEWLTPYVVAGKAYLQLGQRTKALELLESAEKRIAGNPDYDPIQKPLTEMLKALKGH
jgi:hypothetical protein